MQKQSLATFKLIDAQSMAGDVTSSVVGIKFTDNISIQMSFTGTPTGVFDVQVSNDYDPNLPTQTATWSSLTLSATPVASGSGDSILMDLTQVPAPFIRVKYTRTSGSGTLNATIAAKGI